MRTRVSILSLLLAAGLLGAAALADENKWTGGAGDGKWESGGNWSKGRPPNETDDVKIPPNSGEIKVDGKDCKKVKSLDVQDSDGAGTTIRPDGPGESVCIKATGNINIGKKNTVRGNSGNNGQRGGNVELKAGGTITNDGKLIGGDGGTGSDPEPGGHVKTDGKNVINNGEESGGKGGNQTGSSGKGSDGGGVTNNAEDTAKVGKKSGGAGGTGPGGSGKDGRVGGSAGKTLAMLPGDRLQGSVAMLSVHSGQMLMNGLPAESILADAAIYIDAGSPTAPIMLMGIPAGVNAMVAGASICVRGQPLLDPNVTLADITDPDAVNSGAPCLSCVPNVPWMEDFDVWADGYWLDHVGGWKGWDGLSAAAAPTTAELARSLPNSVLIGGAADLVHEFCGADSDIWVVRLWQFVPGPFTSGGAPGTRGSYVVLLNTYQDLGPYHWSAQLHVDSDTQSFLRDGMVMTFAPLIVDEWVELRVVVNFATDTYRVFYHGAEVGTAESWTAGVYGGGGGALNLAALDLYANDSSPVYYDDLEVALPAVGDMNCDGAVDFGDINPFVLALSDPAGYEAAFPGCSLHNADANRNGVVGFDDINPFVELLSGQ